MIGFGIAKHSWFGMRLYGIIHSPIGAVQDYLHVLKNMRNRLANLKVTVMIGDKFALLSHLKDLVNNPDISPDEHGMFLGDVDNSDKMRDKMNTDSALRICSDKVLKCLHNYVEGSEGTQQYIKVHYIAGIAYTALV